MASKQSLNVEQLIAPIAGGSPAGDDLRAEEDSLYHHLRFLRVECREEERQFDAGNIDAPDGAKWEELARGCELALREKTKDLEIACWLLEAQARVPRDGASEFAGLRDGFKLVNALCTRYWDALFSVQDDADPAARFAPIQMLDGDLSNNASSYGFEGALVVAIRKIPLTPRKPPGPFSYWQIDRRDKFKMEDVYEAVRQAGFEYFRSMAAEIEGATTAAEALDQTLTAREVSDGGASRTWRIREALYQTRKMVGRMSSLCSTPASRA